MTKEQKIKLVEEQEKFYNSRDLEGFCSCFHKDVYVERLLTRESYQGLNEFRTRYRGLFEKEVNNHCEIKSRIVLNETIIDEEWITGNSNFPEGLHAVAIYGFRDGLIDRVWFTR